MPVGREFRTGIRVRGLPIKVKQGHASISKAARQSERVLDQLRRVQPDVAVRSVDKAEHLAEISLFAPIVADLLCISGGKRGSVPRKKLGQFGLDPDHFGRTRQKDIKIWRATAAKACRALLFKL